MLAMIGGVPVIACSTMRSKPAALCARNASAMHLRFIQAVDDEFELDEDALRVCNSGVMEGSVPQLGPPPDFEMEHPVAGDGDDQMRIAVVYTADDNGPHSCAEEARLASQPLPDRAQRVPDLILDTGSPTDIETDLTTDKQPQSATGSAEHSNGISAADHAAVGQEQLTSSAAVQPNTVPSITTVQVAAGQQDGEGQAGPLPPDTQEVAPERADAPGAQAEAVLPMLEGSDACEDEVGQSDVVLQEAALAADEPAAQLQDEVAGPVDSVAEQDQDFAMPAAAAPAETESAADSVRLEAAGDRKATDSEAVGAAEESAASADDQVAELQAHEADTASAGQAAAGQDDGALEAVSHVALDLPDTDQQAVGEVVAAESAAEADSARALEEANVDTPKADGNDESEEQPAGETSVVAE